MVVKRAKVLMRLINLLGGFRRQLGDLLGDLFAGLLENETLQDRYNIKKEGKKTNERERERVRVRERERERESESERE